MATNIEIKRNNNENNLTLLKRFNRRIQESGIISRVKKTRYAERSASDYKVKQSKLTSLKNRAEFEKKVKLGKISPNAQKRGRR